MHALGVTRSLRSLYFYGTSPRDLSTHPVAARYHQATISAVQSVSYNNLPTSVDQVIQMSSHTQALRQPIKESRDFTFTFL
jgi:hypothetical protein